MYNYFRFQKKGEEYLITNDLGKYYYLDSEGFHDLVNDRIHEGHKLYQPLYDRFFVYDEDKEIFLQRIREVSRTSKRYLFAGTSLFIMVMTNSCNMGCVYCQASSPESEGSCKMSMETAKKSLDLIFSSPTPYVTIEFQGGEPLLNWEVLSFCVIYAEQKAQESKKTLNFALVSNLTNITEEMFEFIEEHDINLSTSLDGNKAVHDWNRPFRSGKGSYDSVASKIKEAQNRGLSIGAIETTTSKTLNSSHELIEAYVNNNMHTIFLRPLTPLGIAGKNWDMIGYTPEQFVSFYKECLDALIRKNLEGYYIAEGHAQIFLSKILAADAMNYMELRSPCGAGVGQVAIHYNGNIYTCDEGRMVAEMGDNSFMLGTVDQSYDELIDCSVCKSVSSSSLLECIPECCDCVYEPYCGTCPVINYALYKDIYPKMPNQYRCKIYKGILDSIFDILKENDEEKIKILQNWIKNQAEDNQ